jgi:hypothetical protein
MEDSPTSLRKARAVFSSCAKPGKPNAKATVLWLAIVRSTSYQLAAATHGQTSPTDCYTMLKRDLLVCEWCEVVRLECTLPDRTVGAPAARWAEQVLMAPIARVPADQLPHLPSLLNWAAASSVMIEQGVANWDRRSWKCQAHVRRDENTECHSSWGFFKRGLRTNFT